MSHYFYVCCNFTVSRLKFGSKSMCELIIYESENALARAKIYHIFKILPMPIIEFFITTKNNHKSHSCLPTTSTTYTSYHIRYPSSQQPQETHPTPYIHRTHHTLLARQNIVQQTQREVPNLQTYITKSIKNKDSESRGITRNQIHIH